MTRLRALIDQYLGKALRYSAVSVIGVVVTEALLVLFYDVLFDHEKAALSNFLAVVIASLPAYLLNRAWVWNKTGAHSFTREVAPFWLMSLLGLALSTVAVAVVSDHTDATIAIAATNLAAFGVLWVAKFIVLERLLFATKGEHATFADAEPWVIAPHEEHHA
jgi:putative flippase GtrA